MVGSGSQPWPRAAITFAAFYGAVGIVFGALAGGAASNEGRVTWRLTAWLASAVAFGIHIGHEQLRLRTSPATTAFHASLAAALGACFLAAVALVRSLATGTGNPRLLAIALVAFPALTVVPAFLVALTAAALLSRARRRVMVHSDRRGPPGGRAGERR